MTKEEEERRKREFAETRREIDAQDAKWAREQVRALVRACMSVLMCVSYVCVCFVGTRLEALAHVY